MATATTMDKEDLRKAIEQALRKNRYLIEREIATTTEECLKIIEKFIADNNLQRPF